MVPEMMVSRMIVKIGFLSTGRIHNNILGGMSPIAYLADLTIACGVMW